MNVAFDRFILGILTYLLPGESCLHTMRVWPQILPPSQTNKDQKGPYCTASFQNHNRAYEM